jgi:deoxycytidylate deaminase
MKLATHIKSGKAFEGHMQHYFFVSREVGTDNPYVPRDSSGFSEWRDWTEADHHFNLPHIYKEEKLTFNGKPHPDGEGLNIHLSDEAGHWDTSKIEKHWKLKPNSMKQCKKQTTYAVIMKDGEFIASGSNEVHVDMGECPRDTHGFKSGEGYHLCKSKCKQKHHAEVSACVTAQAAGKSVAGATLYLMGHTYCCDDCIRAMADHGIFEVVLCDLKENNRFSPVGAMLAKKYEKMNIFEFMDSIGLKNVDNE